MDTDKKPDDKMRDEYDFSKAERGRFYHPLIKRPKLPPDFDDSIFSDPSEIIRQGRLERDVQIFMALGDDLLRPIASKHGVNWDELDEDEREHFLRELFDEE
jgi:hypothetical protein